MHHARAQIWSLIYGLGEIANDSIEADQTLGRAFCLAVQLAGPLRIDPADIAVGPSIDDRQTAVSRVAEQDDGMDHHIGPKGLSPEKTENAAREVARSIVLRDPDSVDDDVFGR